MRGTSPISAASFPPTAETKRQTRSQTGSETSCRAGDRRGNEIVPDSDRVSLTTAIAGLRQQIRQAAEQAQNLKAGEPKFRITAAELELTVVAEDTASGGGEVGWWVFKARADLALKDSI